MGLKIHVYLWAKPGEDRVYVSSRQPPVDNVNSLKEKGYQFFRLETELPEEFEIANQKLSAKAVPLT